MDTECALFERQNQSDQEYIIRGTTATPTKSGRESGCVARTNFVNERNP